MYVHGQVECTLAESDRYELAEKQEQTKAEPQVDETLEMDVEE